MRTQKSDKEFLRKEAEKIVDAQNTQISQEVKNLSLHETQEIIHELEVHQIELKMQNQELLRIQKELQETKQRYFDLYDIAPIGYCTLSIDGLIQEANLAILELLGIDKIALLNQPFSNFIFSKDQDIYYLYRKKFFTKQIQQECELRILKEDKTTFWASLSVKREKDSIYLIIKDITSLKEYENSLKNIAHFDQLTKLPNRVLLADRLENGMRQAKRNKKHIAVIFLDLDGFKDVNDNFGHDVGDKLLIVLAQEMKTALREVDTLSRIGGDEFVAVLFNLDHTSDALPIITRLLESASKKIKIDELFVQVSASLGISFYPQNDETITPDILLRQSDQAMYQAKLAGKNRYNFFNTAENNLIRERYEGIEQVRLALENREFELYYQPKINMHTGEIKGAEALIRWHHPEKGIILPNEFLPAVEEHPLSIAIGEWVLDTTLSQIELFQKQGNHLLVSVNIGAFQLLDIDFIKNLKAILSKHPTASPHMLELEVLETNKIEDFDLAKEIMQDCIKLGVSFSLDDFGTGYSSLIYLKQLPIRQIKIDQSFIRTMLHDSNDLNILEGIIGLGKAFNHSVIAEGVETSEHVLALLDLGCYLGQGYAISRPLPVEDFTKWLHEYKPNPLWTSHTLKTRDEREIFKCSKS